jgi:hypothetical protein
MSLWDPLTEHLRDFNRDYLSSRADRHRACREVLAFLTRGALFLATAWLLWILLITDH